jgi:hypothetical protein
LKGSGTDQKAGGEYGYTFHEVDPPSFSLARQPSIAARGVNVFFMLHVRHARFRSAGRSSDARVKQVHWDGAKDEDAVLMIMGEGPATSTPVEETK